MLLWIKFIIFALASLVGGVGFIYYLIAGRNKTTNVKSWLLFLVLFALFGFLAERYYTALFE